MNLLDVEVNLCVFQGLPEYSESAVFHRLVSWETRPRMSARCHLPLATLSPFFLTAFLCFLLCYFSPRSPRSTFRQMLQWNRQFRDWTCAWLHCRAVRRAGWKVEGGSWISLSEETSPHLDMISSGKVCVCVCVRSVWHVVTETDWQAPLQPNTSRCRD